MMQLIEAIEPWILLAVVGAGIFMLVPWVLYAWFMWERLQRSRSVRLHPPPL